MEMNLGDFNDWDIEDIREYIEERIQEVTDYYHDYISEINITWKEEKKK